jgi:hypothetical protein
MTKRYRLMVVFALLLLFTFIGWTAAGQKKEPAKPQAWEYRFDGNLSSDQLNQLGAAGWEMVNFTITDSRGITYILKRAK